MAAHREFSWPPARSFVSAYKENLMAADTALTVGSGQVDMHLGSPSKQTVGEAAGVDGLALADGLARITELHGRGVV